MKIKYVYLALFVIGAVVPYYHFIRFLMEYGFDPGEFYRQLWVTRMSTFFALDLLITVYAALIFMRREAKRLGMRRLGLCIGVTLLVGLSAGFPLFLYFRETDLDKKRKGSV